MSAVVAVRYLSHVFFGLAGMFALAGIVATYAEESVRRDRGPL